MRRHLKVFKLAVVFRKDGFSLSLSEEDNLSAGQGIGIAFAPDDGALPSTHIGSEVFIHLGFLK